MSNWIRVPGVVIKGHGVASGQADDPRFPGGTLQMQKPVFEKLGLCLDDYFLGTINVSIDPYHYELKQSKYTFRQVQWAVDRPAEDFSFFDCRLRLRNGIPHPGLIYYPHPETKPEHFQDPGTLEVLTAFIGGLGYGDLLVLELDSDQMVIGEGGKGKGKGQETITHHRRSP
ncbi:MAG: hypothetical protein AAFV72_11905 [Cyanobacteria bacterium J06635_1]